MLGEAETSRDVAEGESRPSDDEVRAQLSRIIGSAEFSASARDRKFLQYIVEETLAGRADRIKAYSIGTQVFGRDPSFDAQNDPVVRIEAGRLRRALERYYLVAGQADPVLIAVPKGGYVPTFTQRSTAPPSSPDVVADVGQKPVIPGRLHRRGWVIWLTCGTACGLLLLSLAYLSFGQVVRTPTPFSGPRVESVPATRPLIIVVPFADLGEGPTSRLYATGLTEEVLSQLARFSDVAVMGRDTSNSLGPSADVARLRREFGIRFAIEGSVRASNGRLRVSVRLLDAEKGAVLWSRAYDEDLEARDFLAIQNDVAQKVATTLAQPYGVIFRTDQQRSQALDDPEAYACTSQYYTYRAVRSPDRHAALRSCMEQTVARFPRFSTGWAMLSFLYLDEDRFGFNPTPGAKALERATDAARRAVALNPEDVRALQALMTSLFLNREHDEALRVGERALTLNPNDTELLGELGSRVSLNGDWQRGAALVERARALNPAHAGFYNGTLALCAYMQGNYEAAASLIRQTHVDRYPFYHLVAAIALGQLGSQESNAHRASFLRQRPEFADNWQAEWSRRLSRAEDRAHLDEGARKAGFIIRPGSGSSSQAPR